MNHEDILELKIYYLSMQQMEPLLKKKTENAMVGLIQKFNHGEDITRAAAKLSALHEITSEVKSKIKKYESLEDSGGGKK